MLCHVLLRAIPSAFQKLLGVRTLLNVKELPILWCTGTACWILGRSCEVTVSWFYWIQKARVVSHQEIGKCCTRKHDLFKLSTAAFNIPTVGTLVSTWAHSGLSMRMWWEEWWFMEWKPIGYKSPAFTNDGRQNFVVWELTKFVKQVHGGTGAVQNNKLICTDLQSHPLHHGNNSTGDVFHVPDSRPMICESGQPQKTT